jgi:membrane peptidoglycan carboxypeptidase
MAAAYATVAARGLYCSPIAIGRILTGSGASLPVKSANCRRVLSTDVADAASQILQGVITSGTAAAPYNRAIGVPAAAKTGTSDGGFYAAFGGYTPGLAGFVSVFNPTNPTTGGAMVNGFPHGCYRENPATGGSQNCVTQMFGDMAPGATWQMTFMHADLGNPSASFVDVAPGSPFFSMGDGVNSPKPPKPPGGRGRGGGGGGGRGGGGHLPALPTPPIGPLPPVAGGPALGTLPLGTLP